MVNEQDYNGSMSSNEYSPAIDEHKQYSRGWEWYMVFCFTFLILEAFFNSNLGKMLDERAYWFTRLTPWNLLPSVMYFYTFGLLIGLIILIGSQNAYRIPCKGKLAFFVVWLLFLSSAVYGAYAHNFDWHRDMRRIILPAIVVPWAIVLASNIRINVVMGRVVKISVLFAVANLIRGILFFKGGGQTYADVELSSGSWQADFILIFAYVLAFARSISSKKGSKLTMVILAIGILAPLHKQTLAMFLVANMFLVFMAIYSGRDNVKLGRTIITLFVLGIFGAGFAVVLLELGGGSAKVFLQNRIFKGGRHSELVSGAGRTDIWRESLIRWTKKPVFGEGLGAAHLASTYNEGIWYVPVHNFAIQLLMQTGLVGFMTVFIAMMLWLIRAVRTLKYEPDPEMFWVRLGLLSFVVALLVTCLFGYYIAARCVSFMLWFAIAFEAYGHSRIYSQMEQIQSY